MLVLTRKPGEKILIGDDIVITVLDVRGDSIRIGVDAPRGVKIQRDEVLRAVIEANLSASRNGSLTDEDAEAAEAHLKAALGLLRPPLERRRRQQQQQQQQQRQQQHRRRPRPRHPSRTRHCRPCSHGIRA
ncbi:carbon storage regulator CsrA [Cryobacterium breve]|uniref:Translational regulator CsrA n=2 Tax=Cryobacterium breve TaxID=1259258 RepID=A0ABY7NK98_9MICO|nr:carbon storage regulator CsrA [Cryobacterium breve]